MSPVVPVPTEAVSCVLPPEQMVVFPETVGVFTTGFSTVTVTSFWAVAGQAFVPSPTVLVATTRYLPASEMETPLLLNEEFVSLEMAVGWSLASTVYHCQVVMPAVLLLLTEAISERVLPAQTVVWPKMLLSSMLGWFTVTVVLAIFEQSVLLFVT